MHSKINQKSKNNFRGVLRSSYVCYHLVFFTTINTSASRGCWCEEAVRSSARVCATDESSQSEWFAKQTSQLVWGLACQMIAGLIDGLTGSLVGALHVALAGEPLGGPLVALACKQLGMLVAEGVVDQIREPV